MWVSQVIARRFRGFQPGIQVQGFTNGLNILYGNNATGKSTLASVILYYFGSPLEVGKDASLSVQFDGADAPVTLTSSGFKPQYNSAHYLYFPLQQLLDNLTSREKSDFESLLGDGVTLNLSLETNTRLVPTPESNSIKEAEKVFEEESTLPNLIEQRKEADIAVSQKARLEQFSAYQIAAKRMSEVQAQLESISQKYPEISKWTNEWLENTDSVFKSWEGKNREFEQASQLLVGLEASETELDQYESLLQRLEGNLKELQPRLSSVYENFDDLQRVPESDYPSEAFNNLDGIWQAFDSHRQIRAERIGLNSAQLRIDADLKTEPGPDLEEWVKGFVQARSDEGASQSAQKWGPILLGCLILEFVAVVLAHSFFVPALALAGLVFLAGLGIWWLSRPKQQPMGIQDYAKFVSEGKDAATREAHRVASLAIESKLKEISLDADWADWETKLREWKIPEDEIGSAYRSIGKYQAAVSRQKQLAEAKEKLEAARRELASLQVEIGGLCDKLKLAVDHEQLNPEVLLNLIKQRLTKFREYQHLRRDNLNQESRLRESLFRGGYQVSGADGRQSYGEFIDRVRNAEPSRRHFEHLNSELRIAESQWNAEKSKLDKAKLALDLALSEAEIDRAIAGTESITEETLTATIASCDEKLRVRDELIERIASIRANIEARERLSVADAQIESETLTKNRAILRQHIHNYTQQLIHKAIYEQYINHELPEIIALTQKNMIAITGGRFSATATSAQPMSNAKMEKSGRFMVRDLKKNRDILLNEASTGTKVNLLISAKLALLEISERSTDVNFPIIFDDALAVADGSAKKAIAETLRIIAEQGRQVICLTADESDAELLETYGGKRVEITPATD